jgi:cell division protein FtsI (penicillin-binding protein 3)
MAPYDQGIDGGAAHIPTPRTGWQSALLLLVLLMSFLGLFGRLVYIHAHDGAMLTAYAQRQQRSTVPLAARRGMILDAKGGILAGSQMRYSVFADPKIIPDKRRAAAIVAEVLGRGVSEVEADLEAAGNRRFFVLARDVSEEQAQRISNANIHGIGLFDEPYRVYPMGAVGAHLVGFVAGDGHGVSGLEHQFESWLTGSTGYKTVVRDRQRRAYLLSGDGFQPSRDGLHIQLTIDAVIQEQVERLLAEAVRKYGAEAGMAVVMRPATGDVLAMATAPGFDPHAHQDYAPSRYRNRVLTDPMEPGSIFKPFVAAAALNERVVSLNDVFFCHNGLFKDGARLLHDTHPHGDMTVQDIMVHSSNIGMALIGKKLGNARMHQYIRAFGFGEKTGIDLDGEDSGIVRPLHRWNDYSTTSLPMGQEIAVTPLQLVRAFSVFANGGMLVRPRIVRAIVNDRGEVVREFALEPPTRVLPESTAALVKDDMLVEAVKRGTGDKAALSDYQVFGKTGTAQIAKQGGGGYARGSYLGSFVAGAPAYAPQVVVIVSIAHPDSKRGYYGGTVAAPTAGRILGFTLDYLGVPPDPALARAR